MIGVVYIKSFQLIAFVFEIIILIILITLGIFYSLNIIKDDKSWLKSGKPFLILIEIIMRIAAFLFLLYWGYISLIPRIQDVPSLVKGNLNRISGYAIIGKKASKDFYDHIYIEGTRVDFFLDAGVKSGEKCTIYYLPKSRRGISIEKDSIGLSEKQRKVGVPWGPILSILYILVIILFINLAFWFLIIGSMIFYPLNLYLYIYYGRLNGAWSAHNNDALANIIGGIGFLAMLLIIFLLEKLLIIRFPEKYHKRFGDYEGFYITKLMAHFVVFVDILSTLSILKLI